MQSPIFSRGQLPSNPQPRILPILVGGGPLSLCRCRRCASSGAFETYILAAVQKEPLWGERSTCEE
eukprot:14000505-Alexandrium_andersonii.AAC.1